MVLSRLRSPGFQKVNLLFILLLLLSLQKRGAQQVVLEGVQRHVWENAWSEFSLDLHLMSCGAAQAMVHAWLLSICSIVFAGRELPEFVRYEVLS